MNQCVLEGGWGGWGGWGWGGWEVRGVGEVGGLGIVRSVAEVRPQRIGGWSPLYCKVSFISSGANRILPICTGHSIIPCYLNQQLDREPRQNDPTTLPTFIWFPFG